MSKTEFDVVVIGAGPGGYVAAIRAAQLGQRVAVVEREHLGGICLNWGCIPTKALLASAEVVRTVRHADTFGVATTEPVIDLAKIVARSRKVSETLTSGIRHLLKKNKVTIIEGTGRVGSSGTVEVEVSGGTRHLTTASIVLATGARARSLPGVEADEQVIMTYKGALRPTKLPQSMLVIGSGAIGTEFASFYATVGSKVTLVETQDRIVPAEDVDISKFLLKSLESLGIEVLTSASVSSLKVLNERAVCTVTHGGNSTERSFDACILAVGIVPNTEGLGLAAVGIATEDGRVVVDNLCRTSVPGIYAIGDIVPGPWLAHKASHEGIIVAEHIAGQSPHGMDRTRIPACTYSHPQIASIGLTEQAAQARNLSYTVGKFPFSANGKALATGESDGLVKTIYAKDTGELLGAHLIGGHATELIATFAAGMALETTWDEMISTVFPHPTLSEMLHESTLAAQGRSIHI